MRELELAVAARLGAAGIGVWSPDDPLPAGVVGIVCGLEPDKPDSVVTVNTYSAVTEPASGEDEFGVQAKIRGVDRETAGDLAGLVIRELDLLANANLGDVRVTRSRLASVADLGTDESGRGSYTVNFHVLVPAVEDLHA